MSGLSVYPEGDVWRYRFRGLGIISHSRVAFVPYLPLLGSEPVTYHLAEVQTEPFQIRSREHVVLMH